MNKDDMTKKMAKEFSITKDEAARYVEFVLDTAAATALSGERVTIGKHRFERAERAARRGRNIRTGEAIEIPAKVGIKYRNVGL